MHLQYCPQKVPSVACDLCELSHFPFPSHQNQHRTLSLHHCTAVARSAPWISSGKQHRVSTADYLSWGSDDESENFCGLMLKWGLWNTEASYQEKLCRGFREASSLASPPPGGKMTERGLPDFRAFQPRSPLLLSTGYKSERRTLKCAVRHSGAACWKEREQSEPSSQGTSDYAQVQRHLSCSPVWNIWISIWLISKGYPLVCHWFPFEEPLGCNIKVRSRDCRPLSKALDFSELWFLICEPRNRILS